MSAIHELLTEHLDLWTAADTAKKSGRGRGAGTAAGVYGIKKLRELILELAVRGKLVPQDANDEPASELLKRIQAEKAKLIAEGKIKNSKSPLTPLLQRGGSNSTAVTATTSTSTSNPPPFAKGGPGGISDEQQPFELPQGWEWVRLGEVCSYIQRGKGPVYTDKSDYSVISQKCVRWTGLDLSQARFIDSDSIHKYEAIRMLCEGDVLWNSTGTGTIGRACVIPELEHKPILVADSHVTVIRPIAFLSVFLWRWIQSPSVQSKIESAASGTTNQIELNTSTVISHPFPLPPLAEQHRIVAKVDELMALCDQLETQHNNAAEAHEKLVSHLLGTLTQSQKTVSPLCKRGAGGDLDWQRIAAHFDTLFTTQASIDALKQTLLQLAVMGKLEPQNPNDESVDESLALIQSERAFLIKTGRIRKEKPLTQVSLDNIPFQIPDDWRWKKIGDTALFTEYGISLQTFDTENGVPVLKMGDIQNGQVLLGGQKKVPELIDELPALYLDKYDLLYNRTNSADLVGKTGIYLGNDFEYTFASYLIRIRFSKISSNPEYFNLAMNAPFFRDTQISPCITQQCGQANVNGTMLKNMIVPIPPLAEQHRIVAKVEELMALCDQLKARLAAANQLQQKLADGMVERAIMS
ncbi:restriction endonuclease subunit S [Methylomonas sp. EFPC1]|uniref:restriction endonuclease subunit S n=1 Tax=Methylomonas sp. EFPC1 TaxID=2812647 RepID=UPI0019678668|nr:restriction endonuclease subunit S [Methylomonas sp. EFPC1]QSB00314.1 restriction endonuclease subunit S [Methylomonas sp. EFPC1]